jgi:hypothetical protein
LNENGYANLHLGVTGVDQWAKAANIVTGINQGLELMEKGLRAATGAVKMFVDTGAMFGAYERQLAAITGSAEKAHQTVTELVEASKSMGDPIQEIMEATKQLELFGLYSSRNLAIVEDAAKGMGKNIQEVVNVIAMASEGNIRGLRRYGIGALDLQRELGHKLKTDTVADLEEIGQAVLSIFEKSYAGAGEAADRSLGGMINQLRNNWIAFKKEVSDAGPLKAAKDILGSILEGVRTLFGSDEGKRAAQIIGKTIADLMYEAALALMNIAREVAQLAASVREFLVHSGVIKGAESVAVGSELRAAPSGVERVVGSMVRGVLAAPRAIIGSVPGTAKYLRNAAYGAAGPEGAAPSAAVAAIDAAIAALQARRAAAAGSLPSVGTPGPNEEDEITNPAAAYKQRYILAMGSYYGARTKGVDPIDEVFRQYGMSAPSKAGAKADVEFEESRKERRIEQVRSLTETLSGYWSSYYGSVGRMSDMLLSHDEKKWKKMRQIAWMGMRDMLADYIETEVKKAAVSRLRAIADMLLEGAEWNWASAAKSAAAALAYGAVGAFAGSLLRGSASDMPSVEEGGGGGYTSGDYGQDNSRTISRSAGVKAQSVTYNLYVIHNAAAIYGSTSGIRELFESQFLPLLREYQAAYAA